MIILQNGPCLGACNLSSRRGTHILYTVPGTTSLSRGERRASNDTKLLRALKRNMSRGNSLADELDRSSMLCDTRAYLYLVVPFWGSYSDPKGNSI